MEIVFEIIMEVLVEGYFEGLVSLTEGFVPGKHLSERARGTISVCVALLACALGLGAFFGVFMLIDSAGKSPWGWGLVSAAGVYLALGIVLKIVSKGKEEKKGPEL